MFPRPPAAPQTNLAEQLRGAGLQVPTSACPPRSVCLAVAALVPGAARTTPRRAGSRSRATRASSSSSSMASGRNLPNAQYACSCAVCSPRTTRARAASPRRQRPRSGCSARAYPGRRAVGYAVRNPATGELGNFVRWEGVPRFAEPPLLAHVAEPALRSRASGGAVRGAGSRVSPTGPLRRSSRSRTGQRGVALRSPGLGTCTGARSTGSATSSAHARPSGAPRSRRPTPRSRGSRARCPRAPS